MSDTDLDARLAAMDPDDPELKARADAALARIVELTGAPTLADYQKVYVTQGWEWPGDEQIRARYLVAAG